MPTYTYRCKCGLYTDIIKPLALIDREEIHCGPMERQIAAPAVRGDYAAYDCPITGKRIEGKRAHEENLAKHGCRILEKGELRDNQARMRRESDTIDKAIEATFEREIQALPAVKREILAGEMIAGGGADFVRKSI